MKKMTEDQIPDFVRDIAETGCDITAVLGTGYVIGDADLSPDEYERVRPRLKEINELYGERDHLLHEIADYLLSIGRYYPKDRDLIRLRN
ncbi:hypothetical protein QTL95_27095 [Rhizobium sp. S152]|uniref:hypothetical protein n=1 Tax=Rhizobium sp. S152 TaxID=3055038 RepID=UPI0025A9FB35|nr:hypothetical protein [Rhizobium sp. S152]MDM9629556.1 hypothetical protein [Rhizobium sp. S152]